MAKVWVPLARKREWGQQSTALRVAELSNFSLAALKTKSYNTGFTSR